MKHSPQAMAAAIEALVAIAEGGKKKPRASELELLVVQAKAAIEALKGEHQSHEG